jgi:DNA polymerase III alpha subunit
MKTELKNRTLWFDGTSQVSPELVPDLLLEGLSPAQIVVTKESDDIAQFNFLVEEVIATSKIKNREFDMNYRIPEKYQKLNLEDELIEDLWDYINRENIPKELHEAYAKRLEDEVREIHVRGMSMLVKTLMYVVDTFEKKGIVWGVGRGSSCASLALCVLGLHKVDPIRFNIPKEEFFHD